MDSRTEAWLRTYYTELSRRKRFFELRPKDYMRFFGPNLKPLTEKCAEGTEHTWVPATTLWIHDKLAKNYINNTAVRGMREGAPFKRDDGITVVPQICWNCCSGTREKHLTKYSGAQRQEQKKSTRKSLRKENTLRSSITDAQLGL